MPLRLLPHGRAASRATPHFSGMPCRAEDAMPILAIYNIGYRDRLASIYYIGGNLKRYGAHRHRHHCFQSPMMPTSRTILSAQEEANARTTMIRWRQRWPSRHAGPISRYRDDATAPRMPRLENSMP